MSFKKIRSNKTRGVNIMRSDKIAVAGTGYVGLSIDYIKQHFAYSSTETGVLNGYL